MKNNIDTSQVNHSFHDEYLMDTSSDDRKYEMLRDQVIIDDG